MIHKEKLPGIAGGISGAASVLGSWQICHNVCLGLVTLLGLMGIIVAGMPLAFLTTIAVPLWSVALLLLGVTFLLYLRKKCISRHMLLINSGLVLAGIPFTSVQEYAPAFWTVGGLIIAAGIIIFIRVRWSHG